jgi:hypothetical protein
LEQRQQLALRVGDFVGVDQPVDCVDALDRRPGALDHRRLQRVSRFEQARRIDEYDLGIRLDPEAGYPMTGRLGLGADRCQVHPDESVQQRRLADVRPTDQRHKACPGRLGAHRERS